jgi:hypothetical protein
MIRVFPRQARDWAAFALVLVCAVGWGFGESTKAPWLFDDHAVAERLGSFADGATAWEFWTRLASCPRPLRQLTLWADMRLGNGKPFFPRAANLAWHAVAAGLWAALLVRLGYGRRVAWGSALLFAVLPVHWETLGVASHRKELLALAFTLAGLLGLGTRGWAGKAAGMACFALAVTGKETAVVFPALAWLVYGGRGAPDVPGRRCLLGASMWGVLLAALAWGQAKWSEARLFPDAPHVSRHQTTAAAACTTALRSFPRYTALMLDPRAGSCLERGMDGMRRDSVSFRAEWALSAAFCAAWAGAWAVAWRHGKRWAMPLGWVPVALAPVLWPPFLADGSVEILAGRYVYAAAPGMALLVALALDRLPGKIPWIALALPVLLLATAAHRRAGDFASERALWEATLRHNPDSTMAWRNLAILERRENGPREALRFLAARIEQAGRNPFQTAGAGAPWRVAVAGDSVPYGWDDESPLRSLSLAARMERRSEGFPGEFGVFWNWAVPGSPLEGLGERLGHRLANNPADFCVIMSGHNDALAGTPPEAMAGGAADAMLACLLEGAVPLWVGPAPVRGTDDAARAAQAAVLAGFDALVAVLCAETGIVHLDCAALEALRGGADGRKGVHLDFGEMENLAGMVFFEGLRPLAAHTENER